jgi:hypothetical protein
VFVVGCVTQSWFKHLDPRERAVLASFERFARNLAVSRQGRQELLRVLAQHLELGVDRLVLDRVRCCS